MRNKVLPLLLINWYTQIALRVATRLKIKEIRKLIRKLENLKSSWNYDLTLSPPPKMKNFISASKNLSKLNFLHGVLSQMKARVFLKYFVSDYFRKFFVSTCPQTSTNLM